MHAVINFKATKLKFINTEIALKVKGRGQTSPKSNHFWGHRNTHSYQFLISSFSTAHTDTGPKQYPASLMHRVIITVQF